MLPLRRALGTLGARVETFHSRNGKFPLQEWKLSTPGVENFPLAVKVPSAHLKGNIGQINYVTPGMDKRSGKMEKAH